jgi:hypothetical protein
MEKSEFSSLIKMGFPSTTGYALLQETFVQFKALPFKVKPAWQRGQQRISRIPLRAKRPERISTTCLLGVDRGGPEK